jgi:energy-coupling factor transporter transmembrane protein EcfT
LLSGDDALHPVTKILGLIFIAGMMNGFSLKALLAMMAICIAITVFLSIRRWWAMLVRMRWLFLSLFIVYGFTTPGQYLSFLPDQWGITYEGLFLAFEQALRLMIMMGLIAIFMATTKREEIIAGFYLLLKPFYRLGVDSERFAARLWLTLHYLEDVKSSGTHYLNQKDGLLGYLKAIETPVHPTKKISNITMIVPVMRPIDIALLLGMLWMVVR